MTPPPTAKLERRRNFTVRFNEALSRILVRLKVDEVPHIKRIIVTVVGGTILVLGVLMFFTPGPAILVVPAGLAILGTEYAWARRWLRNARKVANKALSQTQRIFSGRSGSDDHNAVHASVGTPSTKPAQKDTVGDGKVRS